MLGVNKQLSFQVWASSAEGTNRYDYTATDKNPIYSAFETKNAEFNSRW